LHNCERFGQLQRVHATETLQISRRSHGRLTCCLLLAGRWCLRRFWQGHDNVFLDLREYSLRCACSCSKVPIAPMGRLLTCLPQLSLAQLRMTLWSTTECTCRRDLKFPHCPDGRFADALAFTLAWQLRPTLLSTTVCTCHRDLEISPLPPWETHVLLVVCRAAVSLSMVAQWPSLRARSVGTQQAGC